MKIGFSLFTLMNQRQDKPQFVAPTRVDPQKSEPTTASTEDDPFTKRLKKQQEALESLASLPTPKEAAQQQASDKVGFLRQRIEMLKAMMAFASPEQLKNMAKELKSIARELAGAAKLLSSQGGGAGMTAIPSVVSAPASPSTAVASTAAQPAVAHTSGADSAASQAGGDASAQARVSSDAQTDASAQTAEENAEKSTENSTENSAENSTEEMAEEMAKQEAEKASGEPEGDEPTKLGILPSLPNLVQNEDNRSKSDGQSASEHALRGVLTDAQKALREAVNELKVRLREEDKEARRELNRAEAAMEKTDRAVAASTSESLYSSLGQLLPTTPGDVAVSTPSINIEV